MGLRLELVAATGFPVLQQRGEYRRTRLLVVLSSLGGLRQGARIRDEALAGSSSCDIGLLPQPHGFEGFLLAGVRRPRSESAGQNLEHVPVDYIDRDAATSTDCREMHLD